MILVLEDGTGVDIGPFGRDLPQVLVQLKAQGRLPEAWGGAPVPAWKRAAQRRQRAALLPQDGAPPKTASKAPPPSVAALGRALADLDRAVTRDAIDDLTKGL